MCRVLSGSVQRDRHRQTDTTRKNQPKEEDLLQEAVTEGQATRGEGGGVQRKKRRLGAPGEKSVEISGYFSLSLSSKPVLVSTLQYEVGRIGPPSPTPLPPPPFFPSSLLPPAVLAHPLQTVVVSSGILYIFQ